MNVVKKKYSCLSSIFLVLLAHNAMVAVFTYHVNLSRLQLRATYMKLVHPSPCTTIRTHNFHTFLLLAHNATVVVVCAM